MLFPKLTVTTIGEESGKALKDSYHAGPLYNDVSISFTELKLRNRVWCHVQSSAVDPSWLSSIDLVYWNKGEKYTWNTYSALIQDLRRRTRRELTTITRKRRKKKPAPNQSEQTSNHKHKNENETQSIIYNHYRTNTTNITAVEKKSTTPLTTNYLRGWFTVFLCSYEKKLRHQFFRAEWVQPTWTKYIPSVIRSPSESAIPCVLLRIRTCPAMLPDSVFSMLRLASASSPKDITLSVTCRSKKLVITNQTGCERTSSQRGSRSLHSWHLQVWGTPC